jgi:hypothetical protein
VIRIIIAPIDDNEKVLKEFESINLFSLSTGLFKGSEKCGRYKAYAFLFLLQAL